MQYEGDASAPDIGFVHSALVYGSDDAFMQFALPFVEQGVEAGESMLIAVGGGNIENLRGALGEEPDGVMLLSTEEWYGTSAGSRDKLAHWIADEAGGRRVRMLAEPPWAIGNEAQVRDWARHESVTNVVFADVAGEFVCAYDERDLPEEILEHARRTHPTIAGSAGPRPSEGYEEPHEFCGRLNARVERPEGEPAVELAFNLADLRGVRHLVTSMAVACGLSGSRADELALAVNEIASNAVVHGGLPATLRIWKGHGELICEVSDVGEGIQDELAGQLTPPSDSIGGRGIWLARMLCDAVEIRNGTGCTVSIHATAPDFALSC